MDRVFQIFIASADADLKERQAVSNTLAKAGYMPAGMESFPITDRQQLDYIKRIIDRSDYYIMLVGRRYGSLSGDELTFTEDAFEYAQSKGIPILAFLSQKPDDITIGTVEPEAPLKAKLDAFKARLKTGRIVEFWSDENDLCMKVVMAVATAVNLKPGVGWIRGDQAINPKLLQELEKLRIENADLRQKLADLDSDKSSSHPIPGLADSVTVELLIYRTEEGAPDKISQLVLLGDLFAGLYDYLLKSPSEAYVRELVGYWYRQKLHTSDYCELSDNSAIVIRDKLEALGLIKPRSIMAGFSKSIAWSLTEEGRRFPESGRLPRIGHSGSAAT
ncbi:hypothetical protein NB311A_17119 [Nitrobacter sp. Nb-311A]|uniref:DUF4062 domain-containing protein n=1 Tax=unclassified Nitrobacter TaxID=2620411 RepID=UPI000068735B|nr:MULTISPECIES: DUF4062 domain-containing protein [unclassified Nitrobacter]EAQ35518.1 hypothetical protein NB311A_17119 [Nitrobacter sp. Nb-311A]MCV0385955.1 DUF4062 domain-containing protein [Nitrobacter sp.]